MHFDLRFKVADRVEGEGGGGLFQETRHLKSDISLSDWNFNLDKDVVVILTVYSDITFLSLIWQRPNEWIWNPSLEMEGHLKLILQSLNKRIFNLKIVIFRCHYGSLEPSATWDIKENCLSPGRPLSSWTTLGNFIMVTGGYESA